MIARRLMPYLVVLFLLTGSRHVSAQAWDVPRSEVPKGTVTIASVEDTYAKRSRKVWVYTPASYDRSPAVTHHLLVLFDGADYTADIPASTILDNLHAAAAIAPTVAVMIDNTDGRIADLANHQAFADFVAKDLVKWAQAHYRIQPGPANTIAAGYSAGGLAAAYVAYRYPGIIGKVLAQSGAFWRGNEGGASPAEWLTAQFAASPRLPLRFYIEVGADETGTTAGGPVFIETNRRLRDTLQGKGYELRYVEVPGAVHNPAHWRTQLGPGLVYLDGRGGVS
jgi:enterochelin esterase family protein